MTLRKYSFTLMEVMIGFAIISLVLGMIFSSLRQETLLKKKIDTMEKIVMPRVEMQQFLDRVFVNLSQSNQPIYSSKDSKSLHVTFDNGIDPNPLFCREIKGVLLKEKGDFVFKLQERKTVLRKNIKSVSFEFLTEGKTGIESFSTWEENRLTPPLYVKIILNGDEEYAFWVNRPSEIHLKGNK